MGVAGSTLFVLEGTCRMLGWVVGGSGSLWHRGRDWGRRQGLVHWRSLAIPLGPCKGPLDGGVGCPGTWVVRGRGLAWSSSSWGFGISQSNTASWGGGHPATHGAVLELGSGRAESQLPLADRGAPCPSICQGHWACGGRW